jgi:hypothetical protein
MVIGIGASQHHHELRRTQSLIPDGSPPPSMTSRRGSRSHSLFDDAKAQLPPREERLVEGSLPKMMRELPLLCSIRDPVVTAPALTLLNSVLIVLLVSQ